MNIRLTISLFLPAALMLLVGCGGGSQIADTPTPEANVVAKAEVESSPTKEPPKPEPSADTPTPVAKVETKPSSTNVISWD